MDATVNINNPLTGPLFWGNLAMIAKCTLLTTIHSIWLSEEQAAQMCNFGWS